MAKNNKAIAKALDETQTTEKPVDSVSCSLYEKSQSLVDTANDTFKELCLTLENEQTKLIELEERRKKLQEEMIRLKMEIEEEKKSYVNEAETDNISLINSQPCSSNDFLAQKLTKDNKSINEFAGDTHDTYFKVEENNEDPIKSNSQCNIDAEMIQKNLQSEVSEGVTEQM